MKINYTNQKQQMQKNKFAYKLLPSANIGFQGALTRLAQKSPTVSADLLQTANKIYPRDNGIVGKFPTEFIREIQANLGANGTSQEIKKSILGVLETFAKASKTLENIEVDNKKRVEKNLQDFDFKRFVRVYVHNFKCKFYTPQQFAKLKKMKDSPVLKQNEQQASQIIENGMKQYNAISQDAKVVVKKLNEGRYGIAYSISFLDKNNKRIFKTKVMKYYKDMDFAKKHQVEYALKKADIINEEIEKYLLKINNLLKPMNFKKTDNFIDRRRIKLQEKKELKRKQLMEAIEKNLKDRLETNGINREANIGNYLRVTLGHNLKQSDLVIHNYSDLNHNYALYDFSSYDNLGPVTKNNCFEAVGLYQADTVLKSKYTNIIDSRLVDYGGFELKNKVLAENPVARRVYKKIKHIQCNDSEKCILQRIERFNELYKLASKNKLPQSSDVILGLNESRSLIPKNMQYLLLE